MKIVLEKIWTVIVFIVLTLFMLFLGYLFLRFILPPEIFEYVLISLIILIPALIFGGLIEYSVENLDVYYLSLSLSKRLEKRGWKNITLKQCVELVTRYKGTVWVIPPEDEFRLREDYRPSDFLFLLKIVAEIDRARMMEKEKVRQFEVVAYGVPIIIMLPILILVLIVCLSVLGGYVTFGVLLIFILFITTIIFTSALKMKKTMHTKGYDWISYYSAWRLILNTGWRAAKLPTRDEYRTLPGYRDYDVVSLILLIQSWKKM